MTFKKILALMLCLCMAFAFASCDQLTEIIDKFKGGEDVIPDDIVEGITKEEWNSAIAKEKFDNVTFKILVTDPEESTTVTILCKLDGNKSYTNDDGYEDFGDAEVTAAMRNVYMNTVLAILNNFADFTYDAEKEIFASSKDIVYNVTVMEYDAKITVSNAKVKINTDKSIAEISCYMKQEYTENGKPCSLEFDAVFSFYDYGKTVVELPGNNTTSEGGLAAAYENSCKYSNLSIYAEAIEKLNDGTSILEYPVFKTTATSLYINTGSNTLYYSIEDGKTYMFRNTGAGWEKYEMSSHSLIGALVQMYVGQFKPIFDSMVYDAENNVYYAENVEISGSVFDYVSIELTSDGLIYQLKYVMDTYSYETGAPVVQGKGYATMTFCDYGTTVVELPVLGTGGSGAQGAMTKEEWDSAFEKSGMASNVTMTMTSTRNKFGEESITSKSMLKTTATESQTIDLDSGYTTYHSIEDGKYYFYSPVGDTWAKHNANPESSPIGSIVMQQYTTTFVGIYENLSYDKATDAYVGKNFVINQGGRDFTIHDCYFKFVDGKLAEIYYVSDMYSSNDSGEMVLSGTGTAILTFSDYGTTVVELPTEYTDNTTN